MQAKKAKASLRLSLEDAFFYAVKQALPKKFKRRKIYANGIGLFFKYGF